MARVTITWTWKCECCGAQKQNVSYQPIGTEYWGDPTPELFRPPSGWRVVDDHLICDEHDVKIEIDARRRSG